MREFTAAGRVWRFSVTAWDLRVVLQETGFEMVTMLDADGAMQLHRDPSKIVEIIFYLIKDQLDESGIDQKEFFESMTPDEMGDATEALREATIDFFPQHRQKDYRDRINQAEEIHKVTTDLVTAELDQLLKKAQAKSSGTESGIGQESSELNPGNSLCENSS